MRRFFVLFNFFVFAFFLFFLRGGLMAQGVKDGASAQVSQKADMPIKRVALFSSGVGFFEHKGGLSDQTEIGLPFHVSVIDDALKSLVINDPASGSAQVNYPSESTLFRTLRSLSVDLTDNPGVAGILAGLRGVEIDLYAPNPIAGRILGVEYRSLKPGSNDIWEQNEAFLSIFTASGIKTVALKDISGFSFKDQKINNDINRALDLIMNSRASDTRILTVSLPGNAKRDVSISYVIPAPVWKVSYRLDLSQDKPLLQGWAIVDNDSDTDWDNVELSLVTGKPVSFIQRLYAPYRLLRPTLPLAIAGVADAATYNSGWAEAPQNAPAPSTALKSMKAREAAPTAVYEYTVADEAVDSRAVGGGAVQTASAQQTGDQFEFTIKKPVTLARQQSAMLPLVESNLKAEKTLVFSGEKAMSRGTVNPAISAELTNTSGMKLPAGPITVYDGGTYAGDALINFFPENEKRLISYGDDLSVTGSVTLNSTRNMVSVLVNKGVMTMNRKQVYEKTYTIKNAGREQKRLIIEHPITGGASLAEPAKFDERTATVYRFVLTLPANNTLSFTVKEESPSAERVALTSLKTESLVFYVSNQEIPENVRAALQKAVDLKKKADDAKTALADSERDLTRFTNEQNRIRQNLTAAGGQTPQGQEYLKKLSDLDKNIDDQNAKIDQAKQTAQTAQSDFEAYLAGLSL
jgi:hypothetical protein